MTMPSPGHTQRPVLPLLDRLSSKILNNLQLFFEINECGAGWSPKHPLTGLIDRFGRTGPG